MAKNIRWQIPFVSIQGVHYRVDIYDEGTFTPVQLTAGPTPFVTDEDASDDFFAPVRSQSGTLQVCTLKPDGNYITLDELLPANNIARPVRLLNIDNSNAIEWQGFLSCEAYSQDYTGIPQNLDLPLISVLEAMDSIEVELSKSMAFKKILGHVAYAMKAIEDQSGMSLFNQVYIASYCKEAMTTQYFYNNVYFSTEEQISGDNITVEVHSISCKKILEQVAEFLGCCWREVGSKIYLEVVGSQYQYEYALFSDIYTHFVDDTGFIQWDSEPVESADLEDCDWMGNGHQRTVMQGMRRVKVSAKLKDFSCNMGLRECPVGSLVENPAARQAVDNVGQVFCNTNETFYSLADHKHMQVTMHVDYSTVEVSNYDSETGFWDETCPKGTATVAFKQNVQDLPYEHTILWEKTAFLSVWDELSMPIPQPKDVDGYITSFMGYVRKDNELYSGLMIVGIPSTGTNKGSSPSGTQYDAWVWTNDMPLTQDRYVFRQRTGSVFTASTGFIKIDINTLRWWSKGFNESYNPYHDALYFAVRFGNKWAYISGSTAGWSDSFNIISRRLDKTDLQNDEFFKLVGNWNENMGIDEADGLFFPITSNMIGEVSVYVFPKLQNNDFADFITKMDVDYVPPKGELRTDRSENVYATETSQAFRDELSVDCDLASYANNTKLATMLWNDANTPAKLISLGGATVRPEVDLLNRLAAYYGAARQRLELEVAHPTVAPLPLLKLNGIGDGKVYLPLSESRDWQTNVCTLTCFEMPQEPSES